MFDFALGTVFVASLIFGEWALYRFFLCLFRDKGGAFFAALMFAPLGMFFGVLLLAAALVLFGVDVG